MAKHGENIYKRKDGRYEGRYVIGKTADGKTKFGYVYGRQYGQVQRALLQKKAEALGLLPGAEPCRKTFRQWAEEWRQRVLPGSVKQSSYCIYTGILNRHLIPALGALKLSQISPELVQELLQELSDDGLSPSTLKNILGLLSKILKGARDCGLIPRNPCERIRVRMDAEGQRVLSRSEQRALTAGAEEAQELTALLSLYTGMRLGEVCALKWSDINWEQRAIHIQRTVQRIQRPGLPGTELSVGSPKSSSSRRTIPIPTSLLAALHARRAAARGDGYIFGSELRPAEPRTVQRRFQALALRCGVKNVHFHTLRHSFATRMLELGVDVKTISTLLGHSSTRTTLDFYAHSLLENQRQAMDRLSSAINEPSGAAISSLASVRTS